MADQSVLLPYHIVKSIRIDDARSTGGIKIGMRSFGPGSYPSFLGHIEFERSADLLVECPSVVFGASGSEVRTYANLGYNPQFGRAAILDKRPGRYRTYFTLSLPMDAPRYDMLVVLRTACGEAQRYQVGFIQRNDNVWEAHIDEKYSGPALKVSGAAYTYKPAFVGGAQKSGTTWLEILLNSHPEIVALGEGELLGLVESVHYRASNRWLPPGLSFGEDLELLHHAFIQYIFRLFGETTGCSTIVDRSPGNGRVYTKLLTMFPNARAVHTVRHPLDVLASRLYHEAKLFEDKNPTDLEAHRPVIAEIASALLENKQDVTQMSLGRDDMWALAAAILDEWAASQREAIAAKQRFPDRMFISQYETLHAEPQPTTKRILEFLGVSADDETVGKCVELSSFENVTGRTPGVVDTRSFFRSGKPLQYSRSFSPDAIRKAWDYLTEKINLNALGYGAETTV